MTARNIVLIALGLGSLAILLGLARAVEIWLL